MTNEKQHNMDDCPLETLTLKIDSELMDQIKEKAKDLDTDVLTYARWCLQTGLFLENVNAFVRKKMEEE